MIPIQKHYYIYVIIIITLIFLFVCINKNEKNKNICLNGVWDGDDNFMKQSNLKTQIFCISKDSDDKYGMSIFMSTSEGIVINESTHIKIKNIKKKKDKIVFDIDMKDYLSDDFSGILNGEMDICKNLLLIHKDNELKAKLYKNNKLSDSCDISHSFSKQDEDAEVISSKNSI